MNDLRSPIRVDTSKNLTVRDESVWGKEVTDLLRAGIPSIDTHTDVDYHAGIVHPILGVKAVLLRMHCIVFYVFLPLQIIETRRLL